MHRRTLAVLISCSLAICGCSGHKRMDVARHDFAHQDYARSYDALVKSARLGDPEAQYAVGYMSYYGLGTPKDETMARMWIRESAAQDYPDAVRALKILVHDKQPGQPLAYTGTEDKYPEFGAPNPVLYHTKKFLKKKEML